jgi:hypothetical protein
LREKIKWIAVRGTKTGLQVKRQNRSCEHANGFDSGTRKLSASGSCRRCEHTASTQDYGKKSRHGLGLSSAEDKAPKLNFKFTTEYSQSKTKPKVANRGLLIKSVLDQKPNPVAKLPVPMQYDNPGERQTAMRHIDIDSLSEQELMALNHKVVARLRFLHQMRSHSAMLGFRIGERVKFHPDGGAVVFGTLTRYNKKTVTVVSDSGENWNVAPGLLSKIESPTARNTKPQDAGVVPFPDRAAEK